MHRIPSGLWIMALLATCVHAQDTATPLGPAFEVASIKRTTATDFTRSGVIPTPGRFVAENVPAATLIGFAYGQTIREVQGVPDWARSERYNVTAVVSPQAPTSDVRLMLMRLLTERFRLAAQVEQQARDVLMLVRDRSDRPLARALQRIDEDCAQPRDPRTPPPVLQQSETGTLPACITTDNFRTLNSGGMSMDQLARRLRSHVGRDVVDQTDLPGFYRFVLRYARPDPGAPAPTDEYPEITTALREQLGLRLTSGKATLSVLIVERFERPTED